MTKQTHSILKLCVIAMLLLFATQGIAKDKQIELGLQFLINNRYNNYLNWEQDHHPLSTPMLRNKFSKRFKYIGEVHTTLSAHRFLEYIDTTENNEESQLIVAHAENFYPLEYSPDSTSTVSSSIYWPRVWLNRALTEDTATSRTPSEYLALFLKFVQMNDMSSVFRTKVINSWQEIDSTFSKNLTKELKRIIRRPTIQSSQDGYTISIFMLDVSGDLNWLLINIEEDKLTLTDSKNFGQFGEMKYFH